MGAWDAGSFGNDDAMDWLAELEAEGLAAVDGAFRAVDGDDTGYLEAPVCSAALAAAEVVAALGGRPAADLPDELRAWLERHPGAPDAERMARARHAVERVAAASELAELWAESGDAEWRAGVDDLRRRLA